MRLPPESALDRAVLAHRADPTDANRATVMAEMVKHHDRFLAEQTIEFQVRTHNKRGTT